MKINKNNKKKSNLISIMIIVSFFLALIIVVISFYFGYYSKSSKLIKYINENVSYTGGALSAISIAFAYIKYKNDKQEKENEKIENTMKLIDYFMEYIYITIDELRKTEHTNYKKMKEEIDNMDEITHHDISNVKYLSECQNKEKDVIIQIYVLENTDKFDRFESWSLQFLLLNDKELVYDEYISLEFKKSFIYYMNKFSAGMKVIDPDKRIFRSCNKLYEKWNEKYLF